MTDLHPTRDEVLEAFYDVVFVARRRFIETGKDDADHWILYECLPNLEKIVRKLEEAEA